MVLHPQGLTASLGQARGLDGAPASTPDTVVDIVTALGYVQIDTLQVVIRAHYLAL